MSKVGKEIKTTIFKDYNVVFGSVNNKHPKAIYVNITAWAEPKFNEDIDYHRNIKNSHKKIKQSIFNLFNSEHNNLFLKDRTIVDLDIRESGIKYGKRSFMSCEITLFIDVELSVNSDIMKKELNRITQVVIDKCFNDNESFNFHKKKK